MSNNMDVTIQKSVLDRQLSDTTKFFVQQVYLERYNRARVLELLHEYRGQMCLALNLGLITREEFMVHEQYINALKPGPERRIICNNKECKNCKDEQCTAERIVLNIEEDGNSDNEAKLVCTKPVF